MYDFFDNLVTWITEGELFVKIVCYWHWPLYNIEYDIAQHSRWHDGIQSPSLRAIRGFTSKGVIIERINNKDKNG